MRKFMANISLKLTPIIALFLLANCVTLKNAQQDSIPPKGSKYVAMGSSFAAGPGIGQKAMGAHPNCGQSDSNYPKLLARKLGLELIDVTCGGAITRNILDVPQHSGLLPQIEYITSDTKLVTVTIGGNDLALARDLAIASCNNIRLRDNNKNIQCRDLIFLPATELLYWAVGKNFERIAKEIKRRAPNARIVFLDYQAILPESGNCDAIYLEDTQLAELRERQMRLGQIIKSVAFNNIDYFSAYNATKGHDACAKEPFMAGAKPIGTGAWAIPNFHTTQEGMAAIANGLENFILNP